MTTNYSVTGTISTCMIYNNHNVVLFYCFNFGSFQARQDC